MISKKVILKQYELGPLQNFLYFLGDPATKEIAVIDPAWNVDFLIREAKKYGFTISSVFLTHGHPDHVNGLDALLAKCDVPAYICSQEADFYKPRHKNLKKIKPNESLQIGQLSIKTIHTPGHSPGCQCFLVENILICGDTLFIDGCGRCDLPGSDPNQMYDSLYKKLMPLPDSLIVFSGHNYGASECDTLGNQKRTNPYLQASSQEDFLVTRMGIFR